MGDGSAGVVWFAAPGFRVLSIDDSQLDVVVSIETTADRVGCIGGGVSTTSLSGWSTTATWSRGSCTGANAVACAASYCCRA